MMYFDDIVHYLFLLAVGITAVQAEVYGSLRNKCQKDGVFPDLSDCSRFYMCSAGKKTIFQCPAQLRFNPDILVCDWPINVVCMKDTTTATSNDGLKFSENTKAITDIGITTEDEVATTQAILTTESFPYSDSTPNLVKDESTSINATSTEGFSVVSNTLIIKEATNEMVIHSIESTKLNIGIVTTANEYNEYSNIQGKRISQDQTGNKEHNADSTANDENFVMHGQEDFVHNDTTDDVETTRVKVYRMTPPTRDDFWIQSVEKITRPEGGIVNEEITTIKTAETEDIRTNTNEDDLEAEILTEESSNGTAINAEDENSATFMEDLITTYQPIIGETVEHETLATRDDSTSQFYSITTSSSLQRNYGKDIFMEEEVYMDTIHNSASPKGKTTQKLIKATVVPQAAQNILNVDELNAADGSTTYPPNDERDGSNITEITERERLGTGTHELGVDSMKVKTLENVIIYDTVIHDDTSGIGDKLNKSENSRSEEAVSMKSDLSTVSSVVQVNKKINSNLMESASDDASHLKMTMVAKKIHVPAPRDTVQQLPSSDVELVTYKEKSYVTEETSEGQDALVVVETNKTKEAVIADSFIPKGDPIAGVRLTLANNSGIVYPEHTQKGDSTVLEGNLTKLSVPDVKQRADKYNDEGGISENGMTIIDAQNFSNEGTVTKEASEYTTIDTALLEKLISQDEICNEKRVLNNSIVNNEIFVSDAKRSVIYANIEITKSISTSTPEARNDYWIQNVEKDTRTKGKFVTEETKIIKSMENEVFKTNSDGKNHDLNATNEPISKKNNAEYEYLAVDEDNNFEAEVLTEETSNDTGINPEDENNTSTFIEGLISTNNPIIGKTEDEHATLTTEDGMTSRLSQSTTSLNQRRIEWDIPAEEDAYMDITRNILTPKGEIAEKLMKPTVISHVPQNTQNPFTVGNSNIEEGLTNHAPSDKRGSLYIIGTAKQEKAETNKDESAYDSENVKAIENLYIIEDTVIDDNASAVVDKSGKAENSGSEEIVNMKKDLSTVTVKTTQGASVSIVGQGNTKTNSGFMESVSEGAADLKVVMVTKKTDSLLARKIVQELTSSEVELVIDREEFYTTDSASENTDALAVLEVNEEEVVLAGHFVSKDSSIPGGRLVLSKNSEKRDPVVKKKIDTTIPDKFSKELPVPDVKQKIDKDKRSNVSDISETGMIIDIQNITKEGRVRGLKLLPSKDGLNGVDSQFYSISTNNTVNSSKEKMELDIPIEFKVECTHTTYNTVLCKDVVTEKPIKPTQTIFVPQTAENVPQIEEATVELTKATPTSVNLNTAHVVEKVKVEAARIELQSDAIVKVSENIVILPNRVVNVIVEMTDKIENSKMEEAILEEEIPNLKLFDKSKQQTSVPNIKQITDEVKLNLTKSVNKDKVFGKVAVITQDIDSPITNEETSGLLLLSSTQQLSGKKGSHTTKNTSKVSETLKVGEVAEEEEMITNASTETVEKLFFLDTERVLHMNELHVREDISEDRVLSSVVETTKKEKLIKNMGRMINKTEGTADDRQAAKVAATRENDEVTKNDNYSIITEQAVEQLYIPNMEQVINEKKSKALEGASEDRGVLAVAEVTKKKGVLVVIDSLIGKGDSNDHAKAEPLIPKNVKSTVTGGIGTESSSSYVKQKPDTEVSNIVTVATKNEVIVGSPNLTKKETVVLMPEEKPEDASKKIDVHGRSDIIVRKLESNYVNYNATSYVDAVEESLMKKGSVNLDDVHHDTVSVNTYDKKEEVVLVTDSRSKSKAKSNTAEIKTKKTEILNEDMVIIHTSNAIVAKTSKKGSSDNLRVEKTEAIRDMVFGGNKDKEISHEATIANTKSEPTPESVTKTIINLNNVKTTSENSNTQQLTEEANLKDTLTSMGGSDSYSTRSENDKTFLNKKHTLIAAVVSKDEARFSGDVSVNKSSLHKIIAADHKESAITPKWYERVNIFNNDISYMDLGIDKNVSNISIAENCYGELAREGNSKEMNPTNYDSDSSTEITNGKVNIVKERKTEEANAVLGRETSGIIQETGKLEAIRRVVENDEVQHTPKEVATVIVNINKGQQLDNKVDDKKSVLNSKSINPSTRTFENKSITMNGLERIGAVDKYESSTDSKKRIVKNKSAIKDKHVQVETVQASAKFLGKKHDQKVIHTNGIFGSLTAESKAPNQPPSASIPGPMVTKNSSVGDSGRTNGELLKVANHVTLIDRENQPSLLNDLVDSKTDGINGVASNVEPYDYSLESGTTFAKVGVTVVDNFNEISFKNSDRTLENLKGVDNASGFSKDTFYIEGEIKMDISNKSPIAVHKYGKLAIKASDIVNSPLESTRQGRFVHLGTVSTAKPIVTAQNDNYSISVVNIRESSIQDIKNTTSNKTPASDEVFTGSSVTTTERHFIMCDTSEDTGTIAAKTRTQKKEMNTVAVREIINIISDSKQIETVLGKNVVAENNLTHVIPTIGQEIYIYSSSGDSSISDKEIPPVLPTFQAVEDVKFSEKAARDELFPKAVTAKRFEEGGIKNGLKENVSVINTSTTGVAKDKHFETKKRTTIIEPGSSGNAKMFRTVVSDKGVTGANINKSVVYTPHKSTNKELNTAINSESLNSESIRLKYHQGANIFNDSENARHILGTEAFHAGKVETIKKESLVAENYSGPRHNVDDRAHQNDVLIFDGAENITHQHSKNIKLGLLRDNTENSKVGDKQHEYEQRDEINIKSKNHTIQENQPFMGDTGSNSVTTTVLQPFIGDSILSPLETSLNWEDTLNKWNGLESRKRKDIKHQMKKTYSKGKFKKKNFKLDRLAKAEKQKLISNSGENDKSSQLSESSREKRSKNKAVKKKNKIQKKTKDENDNSTSKEDEMLSTEKNSSQKSIEKKKKKSAKKQKKKKGSSLKDIRSSEYEITFNGSGSKEINKDKENKENKEGLTKPQMSNIEEGDTSSTESNESFVNEVTSSKEDKTSKNESKTKSNKNKKSNKSKHDKKKPKHSEKNENDSENKASQKYEHNKKHHSSAKEQEHTFHEVEGKTKEKSTKTHKLRKNKHNETMNDKHKDQKHNRQSGMYEENNSDEQTIDTGAESSDESEEGYINISLRNGVHVVDWNDEDAERLKKNTKEEKSGKSRCRRRSRNSDRNRKNSKKYRSREEKNMQEINIT